MNTTIVDSLCQEVSEEVKRAMSLHAGMASRHEAHSVILEELEEFWDEVKLNPRKMTPEQQEAWKLKMREELIQTAAMCVRTIADLNLGKTEEVQAGRCCR